MVRTFFAPFVCLAVFCSAFAQDDSKHTQTAIAVDPKVTPASPTSAAALAEIVAGNSIPKTIEDWQAMQVHISELAERVKRATVGIDCGGAQGSGVVVSRDGLVLTAAHVISEPGLDAAIRLPNGKLV